MGVPASSTDAVQTKLSSTLGTAAVAFSTAFEGGGHFGRHCSRSCLRWCGLPVRRDRDHRLSGDASVQHLVRCAQGSVYPYELWTEGDRSAAKSIRAPCGVRPRASHEDLPS